MVEMTEISRRFMFKAVSSVEESSSVLEKLDGCVWNLLFYGIPLEGLNDRKFEKPQHCTVLM